MIGLWEGGPTAPEIFTRLSRLLSEPTQRLLSLRRFSVETLEARLALTGTWTPVTNLPPVDTIGQMVLLSDGSVLVAKAPQNGITSQKLTPDAGGNYVKGTWSSACRNTHARLRTRSINYIPPGTLVCECKKQQLRSYRQPRGTIEAPDAAGPARPERTDRRRDSATACTPP